MESFKEHKNVLVTAWNDSGAGYLMRLLDNYPSLKVMPFETLLGLGSNIGIKSEKDLVRFSNRWNIFRDSKLVIKYLQQLKKETYFLENQYEMIREIFFENELFSWIEKSKFNTLHNLHPKTLENITNFINMSPVNAIKTGDDLLDYTKNYMNLIRNIFYEKEKIPEFRVWHSPSMSLDFHHPNFKKIFEKVIIVIIDPIWGFGNMNKRNNISLMRYLERWYKINLINLNYLKNNKDSLCIITSRNFEDNQSNVYKVLKFLGINSSKKEIIYPTLLGNYNKCVGYPYGGLTSLDTKEIEEIYTISLSIKKKSDEEMFDVCCSLFEELKIH